MSNTTLFLQREMGVSPDYSGADPRPVFANGFAVGDDAPATPFPATGVAVGDTTLTEARLLSFGRLLDAKTAAGASFGGSGANVEAILPGGSITIPAGTLSAGDVVKGRAMVTIPTTVSTDTLELNLRVGGLAGTAISTVPATDVANGDAACFDFEIVVRTATTAAATVTASAVLASTPSAGPNFTALTSLVLTENLVIAVTGEWSTEEANSAILQSFTAIVYGG